MKKILFYSMALAAMTLASCSSDDNQGATENNAKAGFSAIIAGQPQTRAYDMSWENGDAIGITGTTGGTTYTNVKYATANGDGNFAVATAGSDIYYQDNNAVTFTAYYPWNDIPANTITADTWAQADQKSFDFLWSQASGSKANPNVAFTFAHKMAKVVITIRKGADVSFDEVKAAKLSLDGFLHEGTFDVSTGAAAASGNASVMWQFAGNTTKTSYNAPLATNTTAETVAYTLIMFPQEFAAILPLTAELTGMQSFSTNLDFTTANTNAGDAAAKNEWVAGRQYNINVTLNKTSITVNGCTISQWENADGGNFDAE